MVAMRGVDYYYSLWETFLNQMTIEEMASLIANTLGTKEFPPLEYLLLLPGMALMVLVEPIHHSVKRNMVSVSRPCVIQARQFWL